MAHSFEFFSLFCTVQLSVWCTLSLFDGMNPSPNGSETFGSGTFCFWQFLTKESNINTRYIFQIPTMAASPPPPSLPSDAPPPLPTCPPPRPAISGSGDRSNLLKAIQQGKTLKKTITNDRSGLHSSGASDSGSSARVETLGKSDGVMLGKENGVKISERPSGNELMKAILEAKPLRKPSTGMSNGSGEQGR